MPALRYHYSDTIETFLKKSSNEIIGELTLAHTHNVEIPVLVQDPFRLFGLNCFFNSFV